jgi:NAD(P)-dependent dehydrogenase (short-subunit alcohol dehydrogenase family)
MTDLMEGQVAVVTGAASGIGLALSAAFADRGLRVVMSGRHEDELRAARDQVSAHGAEVLALPTDVTDPDAVERLAQAALDAFGTYHIVCNNAGMINPWGPCWETTLNEWKQIIGVNIWGVIHGIRAFVPYLVDQGRGHVLNTSSMAGLSSMAANGSYLMTKHAVVAMTETLRADLDAAGSAIGATVLCPGAVRTPLGQSAVEQFRKITASRGPGQGPDRTSSAGLADAGLMDPHDVAKSALRAIEANRLYAIPSPGSEARIRSRIDRLLSEVGSSS